LLAALALLPPELEWRFIHIGGGTLRDALIQTAGRLGLSHKIEWRGALAQPDVLAAYREADLFVLASKVAKDGDRDGLPNVLIEAQSQRLACIATDVSGIPELIEEGETGLLVPPDDPSELAQAISALIRDPARRAALGAAGERRVRDNFSMRSGIDVLARRFGLSPGSLQTVNPRGAAFQASPEIDRLGEEVVFQVSDF
jgi:glycosyltransferase involved in cell wall biosynthesis